MTFTLERPQGPPKPEDKHYAPQGIIRDLFRCKHRELLIEGPSRTGKSRGCLEKMHLLACAYPGLRVLLVRKTRESITQSVLVTLRDEVIPFGVGIEFHHGDSEWRYPNGPKNAGFEGGSRLVVTGIDDPGKILSTEWDLIYVNQAEELTQDDGENLTTRLSGRHGPYRQVIWDVNPADPLHWLNLRFPPPGQVVDDKVRLLSRHEDNPIWYDARRGEWTKLGQEYIATLDQLTGHRRQRLRLGNWAGAEGMYFLEWDEARHTCEPFEIPTDWPRWLAVDYGFADPCCCLWAARDPKTKRIYIFQELYQTGLHDERQARLIRRLSGDHRLVMRLADPSMFNQRREQNRPSIATIYARNGVRLTPASNNRIAGWQSVRRALAEDDGPSRLQVLRGRAPNLVRTLPQMVVDPFDPEDLADTVRGVKTEDHAVDALRYLVHSELHLEQTRTRLFEFRFEHG